MSDKDGKKPLGLGGSRPGQVKQSFSHGRTKNVVVETKRKKVVVPKPGAAGAGASKPAGSPNLGDPSKRPAGISDAEMERRLRALQAAKAREVEEAAAREAEEKAREEERERRRAEAEAKEREDREREEALKAKQEEEERKAREEALRAQKKEEIRKAPAAKAEEPQDQAAA
ncbi:MAG: IF-2-associated domain-containing protein, partial [Paracoccaceae bacterium]